MALYANFYIVSAVDHLKAEFEFNEAITKNFYSKLPLGQGSLSSWREHDAN
jgi:hypothetical protein|tara:strand:- start:48 stop:200 length:153 start_codon:yes stop_codon:yes gene_type:complete